VKDYYAILCVSRGAELQTIKRSYRLLVQRYHPDVNPDPQAAELIKEINEAYDVLSDSVKRAEYDNRLVNPYQVFVQPQQPEQPSPLRNRDPYFKRRGFRPSYHKPTQHELVMRYFDYVKRISVSGLFVCAFLLIDFLVPRVYRNVPVKVAYEAGFDYLLVEEKYIPLAGDNYNIRAIEQSAEVQIVETFLLRKIVKIQTLNRLYSITTFGTIYGTFKFVPIIVVITALICLLMHGNEEFRFGLCLLTGFALFFTLVLMF
jgi:curved DNA-binding protein CbpA